MIKTRLGKQSSFGRYGPAPVLSSILLAAALAYQPLIATAAELPVPLGSAANFAVLAGSTVTSTGATVVNGDLGVSAGSAVTGFPPGVVNGTVHAADPVAAQAQLDLTTAYNDAAGRSTAPVSISGNLGGLTLSPGLYKSSSSLEISSGDLTLDAGGNANAVFIFQMASTFVMTSGRQVILAGGANATNIYWQVGSSATIGTTAVMKGNILADQSIALQTGATLEGRALARIGAVTMDSNTVTLPGGSVTPPAPGGCDLQISCAFTIPGNLHATLISLNNSTACAILYGCGSSNSANIGWIVDQTNLLSGAVVTTCLSKGCHSIALVANGPGGLTHCETNLCVVNAGDAVDLLKDLVNGTDLGACYKGRPSKGYVDKAPLLAILNAASCAFDQGSFNAGMDDLKDFQHKARQLLGKSQSASEALLIGSAQQILDALHCSAKMILDGVSCGHHHDGDHDDDDQDGDQDGHHHDGDHHDRKGHDKDRDDNHNRSR